MSTSTIRCMAMEQRRFSLRNNKMLLSVSLVKPMRFNLQGCNFASYQPAIVLRKEGRKVRTAKGSTPANGRLFAAGWIRESATENNRSVFAE